MELPWSLQEFVTLNINSRVLFVRWACQSMEQAPSLDHCHRDKENLIMGADRNECISHWSWWSRACNLP